MDQQAPSAVPGTRIGAADADGGLVPEPLRGEVEAVLISEQALQAKLDALAEVVARDYAGKEILLVGVLKGAVMLMADFARRLPLDVSMDFMAVSSYGSSTRSSGVVRILKDLDTEIEGRHVLIVEDIVDSGLTLDWLLRNLRSRRPASLEVLALMTKPSARKIDVPIRYEGFAIDDVFVIGYGLDLAERYRNLPFIGILAPAAQGDGRT